MLEILVVTLGKHGESLIEATQKIIGRSGHIHCHTVDWNDSLISVQASLDETLAKLANDKGILMLTDIFGSTATNISLERARPGLVEVVTGVNLPMIIKASTLAEGTTLAEAAKLLRNQGRKAISIASEKL